MPASRFLALSAAIEAQEAVEDLRALNVAVNAAHPGEKGRNVQQLSNELMAKANGRSGRNVSRETSPLIPGITPGVGTLEDGNAIRAELKRKRAASKAA